MNELLDDLGRRAAAELRDMEVNDAPVASVRRVVVRRRRNRVIASVSALGVVVAGALVVPDGPQAENRIAPAGVGARQETARILPRLVAMPRNPFARTSIWRRRVPLTATFADVSGAMFADPALAPTRAGVDLVTVCNTDATAPLVSIERSSGWTYPQRSVSSGEVLYQRHLAPDACTDVTWNRTGNGLFVLFDPITGLADIGVGGWREPGGPLLNVPPDGPGAHGLDVRRGDGIVGYGRASGLPPLGGLIRAGELDRGIRHALAINVSGATLSADRHFVWPASSADGLADATYQGADPNYAMGTLLAIPRSVRLGQYQWRTPQGRRIANAAQRYGMYIVDSVPGGGMQFGIENSAARQDLGLQIDPVTNAQSVDPTKFDAVGFNADIAQLFTLVRAVTSNAPTP